MGAIQKFVDKFFILLILTALTTTAFAADPVSLSVTAGGGSALSGSTTVNTAAKTTVIITNNMDKQVTGMTFTPTASGGTAEQTSTTCTGTLKVGGSCTWIGALTPTAVSDENSLSLQVNYWYMHPKLTQTTNSEAAVGSPLYVAVGYNTNTGSGAYILTSTDGETWIATTVPSGVKILYSVAYERGRWVAVGESTSGSDGVMITSTDGSAWSSVSLPAGTEDLDAVSYQNSTWAAVGDDVSGVMRILTSADGVAWSIGGSFNSTGTLYTIKYADNLWVAGGALTNGFKVATSPNLTDWTVEDSPDASSATPLDIDEDAEGNWVIAGFATASTIFTSSDPTTSWTTETVPNIGNLQTVGFGNDLWVAGGNASSNVITAVQGDTENWTSRSTPLAKKESIRYFNKWFMVGANSSFKIAIADSTTGTSGWAVVTSVPDLTGTLQGVAWNGISP